MKNFIKYMAMATMAVFATACTQEGDFTTSYLNDSNAVHIAAQVGNGDVSGGFVTRSTPVGEAETAFNVGDKISVAADGQSAVIYTFDGNNTWIPETGKYLKWQKTPMNFTSYYPVDANVDDENFTVPVDQSELDKITKADYMTFTGEKEKVEGNGVTLTMQRKMARIVVNATLKNQFGSDYEISEVTVCGNTKGYASGEKASGTIEVKSYKHEDGNFYALLSPTTESVNDPFLKVTVQNTANPDKQEELIAKGIPATEEGNSYTINLTVGKDVVSVKSVEVKPWNTETIGEGDAEYYPYVTFSAEKEQAFYMLVGDKFSLDEGEYFEYSINNGKWIRFYRTIKDIKFGGNIGNLRLRGKSMKGTGGLGGTDTYSNICFGNSNPVDCTGDIRTLIDYENYSTVSTENAGFYALFYADPQIDQGNNGVAALRTAPKLPATTLAEGCYGWMFAHCRNLETPPALPATTLAKGCYESMFDGCGLTKAPELPATTLAEGCYQYMFWGCRNLSNVTMLATEISADDCLTDWLSGNNKIVAGDNATSRTLKLANKSVYEDLKNANYLPDIWKIGATNTIVQDKDGNPLTE